jgi:hypothetical protein
MNQGVFSGTALSGVTGSGAGPIGTQAVMQDVGPTVTMGDSSVWIRAGTSVTPAYAPQLAAIKNYRLVGTEATTAIPSTSTIVQVASNGAGTLVASTYSVINTVYRSTDNGLTWSTVNPGVLSLANNPYYQGIAYGGGRFVAAVWIQGLGYGWLAYSTDGLTWTMGAQIPNMDGLYNYIRLVYASGQFVGVANAHNNVTAAIGCFTFYSTNGSACTTYNGGVSLNSAMQNNAQNQQGFGIISSGAVVIVFPLYIPGAITPWVYSLDSGVTWSTTTPGSSSGYYVAIGINGTAVVAMVNGTFQYWASLASPTVYTTKGFDSLFGYSPYYASSPIGFFNTGTGADQKTFATTGFGYVFQMSNDLKTVLPGTTTQLLNSPNTTYYTSMPCAATDAVVYQGYGNTTTYDASLSTFKKVGIKNTGWIPSAGANYYNGQTWYVRAK